MTINLFLKILKAVSILIGILFSAFIFLVIVLTITEYNPDDIIKAEINSLSENTSHIEKNTDVKIMSWNIGYCGLGKYEDFFMDGGKTSLPKSHKNIEQYKTGIRDEILNQNPDILILQEIDRISKRSGKKSQIEYFKNHIKKM